MSYRLGVDAGSTFADYAEAIIAGIRGLVTRWCKPMRP